MRLLFFHWTFSHYRALHIWKTSLMWFFGHKILKLLSGIQYTYYSCDRSDKYSIHVAFFLLYIYTYIIFFLLTSTTAYTPHMTIQDFYVDYTFVLYRTRTYTAEQFIVITLMDLIFFFFFVGPFAYSTYTYARIRSLRALRWQP